MRKSSIESIDTLSHRISANAEFSATLKEVIYSAGFLHGFYGFMNPYRMQMPLCSTLPKAWWNHYSLHQLFEVDPLVPSLANRRRPVTFNDLEDTTAFKNVWIEEASEFGVSPPSIGIPMIGPAGETAVMVMMGEGLPVHAHERRIEIRKATEAAVKFHTSVIETSSTEDFLKIPKLYDREKSCLDLVSRGISTQRVADILDISPRTVETHLREARKKLGAKNTVHAVAIALYLGIICGHSAIFMKFCLHHHSMISIHSALNHILSI